MFIIILFIASGSATHIGKLENMEETQQVSWAVHAKSCNGEVDTWTATDVKTVGHVIGQCCSMVIQIYLSFCDTARDQAYIDACLHKVLLLLESRS